MPWSGPNSTYVTLAVGQMWAASVKKVRVGVRVKANVKLRDSIVGLSRVDPSSRTVSTTMNGQGAACLDLPLTSHYASV